MVLIKCFVYHIYYFSVRGKLSEHLADRDDISTESIIGKSRVTGDSACMVSDFILVILFQEKKVILGFCTEIKVQLRSNKC